MFCLQNDLKWHDLGSLGTWQQTKSQNKKKYWLPIPPQPNVLRFIVFKVNIFTCEGASRSSANSVVHWWFKMILEILQQHSVPFITKFKDRNLICWSRQLQRLQCRSCDFYNWSWMDELYNICCNKWSATCLLEIYYRTLVQVAYMAYFREIFRDHTTLR